MLRHLTIVLVSSLALACTQPSEPTQNPEKSDEAAACVTDEAILSCMTSLCPDLRGDAFDACFADNCEEGPDDTPINCALCIVNGFEAGEDAAGIAAVCTATSESTTLTGVACAGDDLALFACLDDNCPDAESSDDLGECIADFCTAEVEQTAITCLMCVDAEAGQDTEADADPDAAPDADPEPEPDATLQESCTVEGSAPCDVDRAAAMQTCAEELCTGQQGDPLDECMSQECPDVFDDVTEQCGGCIIALNQNGVPFGDAAANCAGH